MTLDSCCIIDSGMTIALCYTIAEFLVNPLQMELPVPYHLVI
jgi:uncharacterized membrane protein YwzB